MKIAIIDVDSICFTIGNPNKVLDHLGLPIKKNGKFLYTDKTESELAESADYWMNKILEDCKCTHYIAFIKGTNTIKSRLEINPDYKGNRKKETPTWWKFCKQYLIEKWGAIEAHGAESDDYVNITRLQLKDSFIVAIDNDLLNLEGTHYNWKKNLWVTVDAKTAKYEFWKDMLTGQPGDNIKGIPKVGDKTAARILTIEPYSGVVLDQYIKHFGEELGIKEFYKNYFSLRILDTYANFAIPEPIEYKTPTIEDELTKYLEGR